MHIYIYTRSHTHTQVYIYIYIGMYIYIYTPSRAPTRHKERDCNTPQYAATNTPSHVPTGLKEGDYHYCNKLQHTHRTMCLHDIRREATRCNTYTESCAHLTQGQRLHHTARHCNTHTRHCNTHTRLCNTHNEPCVLMTQEKRLQHTATHRNTHNESRAHVKYAK